ncbi:MAG: peptidoglycan-binding domain-containing protein [Patescibacteria group bacterium]
MPRILTGAGIVVALLAPALAFAAFNDVTLTTDTVLTVNGITLNVSGSSAAIESITVNAQDFSVVLASGSTFQVTAPGLERLSANTATGQTAYTCDSSGSSIKYVPTTAGTVTIAPSATLCSSASGNSTGGSTSSNTSSSSSGSSSGSSAAASTPAATTPAVTTTPTTTTTQTTTTSTTPASGLSVSQVQSILDVLASFEVDAATMASVKAALEGTSTGSATSAAVRVFKSNLTTGSLGSEVKALQEFLNARGYTVSASGAGSPGNETTRFGAATKAALIKYQKAKGITPAVGYFGAKTRAAVDADQ